MSYRSTPSFVEAVPSAPEDPIEQASQALAALREQMARYRPSMLDPHGDIMVATEVVLEAAEALEKAVASMEAMRADWSGADEVLSDEFQGEG